MKTVDGYVTAEDGVRLFYRQIGDGPPVILPNGMHLLEDSERLAASRTLIFYDVRNRGLSDPVTGAVTLKRGILQDAADLETVRRHFQIERIGVIAHSYIGVLLGLYAREHPERVNRIVMIGPMQPNAEDNTLRI
jgi:pimeloyl-ACP methyl ester carboxylesterase